MACICDRVDIALEELDRQLEVETKRFVYIDENDIRESFHELGWAPYILRDVRFCINNFEEEFRYLKIFLGCIHDWSDADKIVPNLGSLVIKIEAAVERFGNQLAEWIHNRQRQREILIPLQEWESKLRDVLESLNRDIWPLKQQISEACDSLVSYSFKCHSPMNDFDQWKKFVKNVELKLGFLGKQAYPSESLMGLVYAFNERLRLDICFLGRLTDSFPNDSFLENVLIHVGSLVINAGLLICQFWNRVSISEKENDVILTLLDLQQKIDFTTPEFAEMYLRLLKIFHTNANDKTLKPVDMFVEHLFTFLEKYIEFRSNSAMWDTFPSYLISVITSVFNMPEEHAEVVQRFLEEIKILIMGVASLEPLLREENEIRSVGVDLVAFIWLTKLEIFLREQLTTQGILSLREQIDVLNQGIQHLGLGEGEKVLTRQIVDSPEAEESVDFLNQVLTFMEELAILVASLNQPSQGKETTTKMVRNMFFKLLLKIVLFKGELLLMALHDSNESLMVSVNGQIETIQKRMKFLTLFVSDGCIEDGEMIFAHIDAVACAMISLCYSFPENKISEEIISHTNHLLATLLDEFKIIMLQLKEIYLHVPSSNFPKINGLGFIGSLLRKLRELLSNQTDSIAFALHQIEQICQDLEFFRSFLRVILNQDVKDQELKGLVTRVVNAAYLAEYLIDSIVGGINAEWFNLLWLYHFAEDVTLIKKEVAEVIEKKTYDVGVHSVLASRNMIKKAVIQRIDEVMLGLNDEEEVIINRLIGGFLQRDIVSIVGMPGIGKTTLAKKVYNCPQVVYHFHIRAWCCVSERYQKRQLLLDILSHITALTDNILAMTDEDLDLKLYQLLKQKKYLIVMDDLWNTGAWDDLGRSFPNDGNGSRILITSRLRDVALKAKAHTDPHTLRLLSDAESWELLQSKIFHEECCPEELMEIGKQIAKSCKGLPLAIVAIAGLLERSDRQLDWWKEIAENLSSRIINDPQQQCMGILELSYNHLPDYLKACFLYFAAFEEDQDIPVRKLIHLWIAEDFIQENESKSLEDLAEDYLNDLIGRSLLIFAQQRSRGGVKTCRIHDMLRNLCQSKAQEENFLRLITTLDISDDSFDAFDYDIGLADPVTYEDHRLCIRSKRKHFIKSRPSGSFVRSLLFFATSDTYPRCPYDISFIADNFEFITVLDLECINMGSSFSNLTELLVHLRYLALSGDFDNVPSSIANLRNLETFLVKGLKGKVELPETFWCMESLRHVHISDHALFSLLDDTLTNSSQLDNLVTLSSPFLPYGEKTSKILRQFPSLQKLRCIFFESWDPSQNCNQFPSLDILSQLESLNVYYYGRALHPCQFDFPVNLKKLTLSNFRLPWDHISAIGRLHNLEVLKLLSRAFEGERWDMMEGEFSKLKFLKLDSLNIVEWNASSDHLPNLQKLVMRCCNQLEEVPSSFGEIPTLEMIEIQWCGDAVEESVRKIREDADERLKVFINLSESHF